MDLKRSEITIASKPISIAGERLEIVVLYADFRDFSTWLNDASIEQAGILMRMQYECVVQLHLDYKHTFHKFLGDGFLLVWEVQDHGSYQDVLHWAIGAAFEIHKKYWYEQKELEFSAPKGMGIGIACGEVVRVQPETYWEEMNEPDLLGYPMNLGARLEGLAMSYGVVLDNKGVELANVHADRILGPQDSARRFKLLPATTLALEKAKTMKGLREEDRTGFQYVTWPHVQCGLWGTDGRFTEEKPDGG